MKAHLQAFGTTTGIPLYSAIEKMVKKKLNDGNPLRIGISVKYLRDALLDLGIDPATLKVDRLVEVYEADINYRLGNNALKRYRRCNVFKQYMLDNAEAIER